MMCSGRGPVGESYDRAKAVVVVVKKDAKDTGEFTTAKMSCLLNMRNILSLVSGKSRKKIIANGLFMRYSAYNAEWDHILDG